MKLSELLNIIGTADRIRIIDGYPGNKEVQFDKDLTVLYSGYKSMIEYHAGQTDFLLEDPEVGRLICHPEIRHKDFAELGLFPPYEPELTRMYEFQDMTMFIYYDIYLFRKEEKKE